MESLLTMPPLVFPHLMGLHSSPHWITIVLPPTAGSTSTNLLTFPSSHLDHLLRNGYFISGCVSKILLSLSAYLVTTSCLHRKAYRKTGMPFTPVWNVLHMTSSPAPSHFKAAAYSPPPSSSAGYGTNAACPLCPARSFSDSLVLAGTRSGMPTLPWLRLC